MLLPGASFWKQTYLYIYTYAIWIKVFLPNTHLDKRICVCYCSTWKYLILTGVSLEKDKILYLISFLTVPRSTLTLNTMLEINDAAAPQLNLTNARAVFILCFLLIIKVTYHAPQTWYKHIWICLTKYSTQTNNLLPSWTRDIEHVL